MALIQMGSMAIILMLLAGLAMKVEANSRPVNSHVQQTGCPDTFAACPNWGASSCIFPGVSTFCPCMCSSSGGSSPPPPPIRIVPPPRPRSFGPSPPPARTPPPMPPSPKHSTSTPIIMAYFPTWSAPLSTSAQSMDLAHYPTYLNTLALAFAKPECSYMAGSHSWSGTGLDFSSDFGVVKAALALRRSAGGRTLLSIGGATFTNWAGLNALAIKALIVDLGIDGVDIDYEPTVQCTNNGQGSVTCNTDAELQRVVSALRSALPTGQFTLSYSALHVGAYGVGAYINALPSSGYTGMAVNLAASTAGRSLDLINIQGYNAGNTFNPQLSYLAFRSLFPNASIVMGVCAPQEDWGGHVTSVAETTSIANFVRSNGGQGMMLWSLMRAGPPSAQALLQAACAAMGMDGCSTPLSV